MDAISTHPNVLPTLSNLTPGAHLCSLYETEEEHRALLTPFLRQGLEQGEKVLYIVDARTAETILSYLRSDGLDVEPFLKCGQLAILTVREAYMRDGIFDPERMIALLRASTEQAVAEGYPALRVTGEMTWALRGLPGSERLIEYEAKLNHFFPGSRCLALCQYDRRRFTPEVQLDILATHPIVAVGTELHDNPYYLPPAAFLAKDRPEARLEQWLNNLAARKQMDATLGRVIHDRGERVKELTCLYRSARLLQDRTKPFADLLQELVVLLPPAWQYPEITAARITLEGMTVATPNFVETPWKQSAAFEMADGRGGAIEVVYLEKKPDEVEGPFLAEERDLINAVADSLVSYQERKQTEEALHASEETFRAMSTSAQDAIILLDAEGTVTFWNQAAERIFGYSAHEVLDRELHRVCAPERFQEAYRMGWSQFRQTGQGPVVGKTLELVARRRDGSEFPIELSASAVKLAGRWHAVGILRDITARVQGQQQLGRLAALVESSEDAIIGKTLDGIVTSWNQAAEQIYGYTAQEMIGRSIATLFPSDRQEEEHGILKRIRRGERIRPYDTVRVRKDGSPVDVSIAVSPVLDRAGRIVGASTIARDVTERRRLEEEQRRLASFPALNPVPIVEIDATGAVTYANPMAVERYPNLTARGAAHPFLRETTELLARLKRESRGTEVREVEVGDRVYVQYCTPVQDYTRLRLYSLDITERKQAESALRRAGAYNRSLIEASLDPLVTIGPDGAITDVNAATEAVTGYARTQLIGTDFSNYFTDPERARAGYQQVFREGFVRDYPLELRHQDGHGTPVLYNASLYRDEAGQVVGVFAAARDITERKRAEAALREQTRLLELFFKYTQTSIVFLDRDFNFIRVNEAYARACHKEVSDFPGHNHFEFYPSDVQLLFENVRESKTPYQVVARPFVFPDHPEWGVTYWDWALVPILDESGDVELFVFSLNDVTDRKRAEEVLRQAGAYNRSLIEASLDPLVTIGPDGAITDVNAATEAATGHSRQELIGTDFANYFAEPEKARAGYRQVFREGLVRDYPLELRHQDGHGTPVLYNASLYRDEAGQVVGVFAAARDITERKKLETSLVRRRDLYNMLSQTNQAIVRCTGHERLFPEVCRIAVVYGRFRFAWIGLLSADGRRVEPAARYGEDVGYVDQAHTSVTSSNEHGRGPTVEAITGGRHVISNDFLNDPVTAPWHEAARRAGVRSSGAFPIRLHGAVIGSINFYGDEPGCFTDDLLSTLDEMALDVSFALDSYAQAASLRTALQVVEASPVVLFRWRPQPGWPVEYVSENVSRWGYPAATLLSGEVPFSRLVYPEDLPRVSDEVERYTREGCRGFLQEYRLITAYGLVLWVEDRTNVVRDGEGRVLGYEGILTDITDRKRAEEALRQAGAYNRSLIEASLDPLVTIGPDGAITDVNAATEAATGHSRQELIGTDFSNYFTDQEKARAGYRRAFRDGVVRDYELEIRHRQGDSRSVLYNASVYRDESGTVIGVFAAARDITERRQMERHAQRIEQLASMGQLLGGIAHELKNPLFIVTGRLQLLKEKLANREYDGLELDLQKIGEAAHRMGEIAQRFLTLARPIQPALQLCSVASILKGVLDFLSNELMKARIRVVTDYAADLPLCLSDAAQLHQVFLNIVMNALQAMAKAHGQGMLTVSAKLCAANGEPPASEQEHERRWIEVRIQDDGPGIPPEHRDKIFEPFFTTKPLGEGTGLGLWTVQMIVATLKGMVGFETEVGQGATFIVRLPVEK